MKKLTPKSVSASTVRNFLSKSVTNSSRKGKPNSALSPLIVGPDLKIELWWLPSQLSHAASGSTRLLRSLSQMKHIMRQIELSGGGSLLITTMPMSLESQRHLADYLAKDCPTAFPLWCAVPQLDN